MDIYRLAERNTKVTCIFLVDKDIDLSGLGIEEREITFLESSLKKDQRLVFINRFDYWLGFQFPDTKKKEASLQESYRLDGVEIQQWAVKNKLEDLQIEDLTGNLDRLLAVGEGLVLKNYQFIKYFSEPEKKKNSLVKVGLVGTDEKQFKELQALTQSDYFARKLINEPLST